MAARSSWKGFLRLSLVSIPVKAYTANVSGSEIRLNQLHRDCHNRIKYRKVCLEHGEVSGDQIVSGYEYAKDQYVVIDPQELDALRSESDKAINVDTFVAPHEVDPVHYTGKNYYLAPDGAPGQKPYALFQKALVDEQLCCIATVVMHGKEQLVLLRPVDDLICMTILSYATEVKQPSEFGDEVRNGVDFTPDELKLTKTLIEASRADDFELANYTNKYTERLTQLIEAKVAGEELVASPGDAPAAVINLMDALKASVAEAQKAKKGVAPKKMAASTRQRKTAKRKKKSG